MATPPSPRPFQSYSDNDLQTVARYVRTRAQMTGDLQRGYADTEADIAPALSAEIRYRQEVAQEAARTAETARIAAQAAQEAAATARAETIIAAVRAA